MSSKLRYIGRTSFLQEVATMKAQSTENDTDNNVPNKGHGAKRRDLFTFCNDGLIVGENYLETLPVFNKLPGFGKFFFAQIQVALILRFAVFGDSWEPSYPRNDNHNMTLFWALHGVLLVASILTWTHKPRERVTLLSREQTEEWKGWMQFSFIMYHYYRAWSAYNWIRVFVSSYVWMTGFGNFLYFDKKKDFGIQRVVSMFIRINYFPLLLSWATGVSIDLYYVVPLHTTGFFMTYLTCLLAVKLEEKAKLNYMRSRVLAIAISFLVQILFFETKAVDSLLFFSDELHFRFQADKYSAVLGIVSGLSMKKASEYITWAYASDHRCGVQMSQCIIGAVLIWLWYATYGHIQDKFAYNPAHPYIFICPLLGWLMLRNSSRYLCEHHSGFLEFLGRNTLETYVLQFHLFMNHSVQFIPVVIPGSGADGIVALRVLNMLTCGTIFVLVAVWARKVTVTTQNTVVGFMQHFSGAAPKAPVVAVAVDEAVELIKIDARKRDGDEFESA
mmetsp:Transcript_22103/g.24857  ORF Transcript_22103/g.24857 Transcript_22103/m.24857 type:complete len:503 (-) Transcript_22103:308-1816(-)